MNNRSLALSYLRKAIDRLDLLDILMAKHAYSDVVREAQEIVELALKGMLREVGIEPPKLHDVGGILREQRAKFQDIVSERIDRLAEISKALRKERELSFYGDVDFIPTEEYTIDHGRDARAGAYYVVETARLVIPEPPVP